MLQLANNAKTAVAAPVTAGAFTITVADASVLPPVFPYRITVWDSVGYPDPGDDTTMEVMEVTSAAGNVLTVTRGMEGTSGVLHAVGERVALLVTKAVLDQYHGYDVIPKAATFTVGAAADEGATVYLADATLGAMTAHLPAAATMLGQRVDIQKVDATANTVTVDGNLAEQVGYAANQVLAVQGDSISLVPYAGAWYII